MRPVKPAEVRLLFIGEAPPASGRLFYHQNSGLYRAIRDAFCAIDSSLGDKNFLRVFRDSGCYLIDLCPSPVDDLDRQSRAAVCAASEPSLGRRIKALQPQMIVTLVRSTRANLARAIDLAKWQGSVLDAPYPGRWVRHREKFLDLLTPELRRVLRSESPRITL